MFEDYYRTISTAFLSMEDVMLFGKVPHGGSHGKRPGKE
jgi:hypothetical protein